MSPVAPGLLLEQSTRHDGPKELDQETLGFGTRAVHVGSEPDPNTGAIIPAISLSTTYKKEDLVRNKGFVYSRLGNPNRHALEQTLASLESGAAYALAFASGSAATATVLQSLGHGAHIVSVNDVYGGTSCCMTRVAKESQGLETTFLDLENANEGQINAALRDNTKLIWIESPTNPTLRLIDIPRIVAVARTHPSHPLVLVDNTFMSPFYSSPLLQDVDIALYSLSKYINGHTDVVMGAVMLPKHHTALHERLAFLRDATGAVPSAYDAWLAQRGAKTLHLRMKEHGRNALLVARALEKSPYVKEVIYPGLVSHPRHEVARRSLSPHAARFVETESEHNPDGSFPYGGMVSFRIRGGLEEAQRFFSAIRVFTLAGSLGGVESLAELPALMTHSGIPPAERAILGIGDDLIRLSVGIEEGADLVWDIQQALREAVEGTSRT